MVDAAGRVYFPIPPADTDSDAEAYENAAVEPLEQRIFFRFDDPHGGRRIESYQELLDELLALPDLRSR